MEATNEGYIKNEDDILYNKDKFDSGEINLCFVIGHSGSGKSTMAHKAEKDNKDVEAYEMDDLSAIKGHFTMENLKEYGDLIYSFFNGIGKKYYVTPDYLVKNKIPGSEYEDKLYPDFVHYAMQYAKTHKNKKYIVEGIWLFCNGENGKPLFNPEEFKDYAFYIKGTSMLVSAFRASKRDSTDQADGKLKQAGWAAKNFVRANWKDRFNGEKQIKRFRDYFKKEMKNQITNEAKFPIRFTNHGDLVISTIKDLEQEYQESHKILSGYNEDNIEGIKSELARLFYINSAIEKKIKKMKKGDPSYVQYVNLRSRVLNDFKKYFTIVTKAEPKFDFAKYFQASQYSNKNIVIDNSTLRFTGKAIKAFLSTVK